MILVARACTTLVADLGEVSNSRKEFAAEEPKWTELSISGLSARHKETVA